MPYDHFSFLFKIKKKSRFVLYCISDIVNNQKNNFEIDATKRVIHIQNRREKRTEKKKLIKYITHS